jgi:phosphoenolpyruvate synthase/pyruvate phosphate dikinase
MIRLLSELSSKDISIAGVKGAYLAELKKAGFNVPDGFVLLTGHNHEDTKEILEAFDELGANFVAVRGSVAPKDPEVAQCVEGLETKTWVSKGRLIETIESCERSKHSKKVRSCMIQLGMIGHLSTAIFIQEMVDAKTSGAVFMNPPGRGKNEMVINACLGGGAGVTSGKVTPDVYIVDKDTGEIIDEEVNSQKITSTQAGWSQVSPEVVSKRKLSKSEIDEVVEISKKICNHFSKPCTIEFCFDKSDKLWILQALPEK